MSDEIDRRCRTQGTARGPPRRRRRPPARRPRRPRRRPLRRRPLPPRRRPGAGRAAGWSPARWRWSSSSAPSPSSSGRGGDEPSAAEALERAQAALAEADSFRMHSTSEDRSVTGDADGAGSSTVYRTVTDVEVAGDAWRADLRQWRLGRREVVTRRRDLPAFGRLVEALADEPWELLPARWFDAALPDR